MYGRNCGRPQKYRTGTLYVENNADKGYSAKNFKSYGLIVSDYHESMNKFMKIVSYLRQYWGQIEWLEGTDPDYINEILDYTENAEHDDSPDSAASLIMRIKGNSGWLF